MATDLVSSKAALWVAPPKPRARPTLVKDVDLTLTVDEFKQHLAMIPRIGIKPEDVCSVSVLFFRNQRGRNNAHQELAESATLLESGVEDNDFLVLRAVTSLSSGAVAEMVIQDGQMIVKPMAMPELPPPDYTLKELFHMWLNRNFGRLIEKALFFFMLVVAVATLLGYLLG